MEDSTAVLKFRNAYIDRDFKQRAAPQSRIGSWTQGFDLQYQSGYTEGQIGVGFDLAGQYALRLDGGGGRGPDTIIPYSLTDHQQARDDGHAAVTGKLRYSHTELKIGEFRPRLPVAYTEETRQLMVTYNGWQIESKEIPSLTLIGGNTIR